jgi:acetylglutamate kinase
MNKLFIIKIGGNVLDDKNAYLKFLQDFAAIKEPKILVHGGGKIASHLGDKLGIKSHYIGGRRITDEPTRDLVTMVYGGLINKQIVSQLQQFGCNAFGFTGADGKLMESVKRPVKEIDYGWVGDITPDGINTALLGVLLSQGIVPIVAPLTYAEGEILNTNADTVASVLAVALSKKWSVRLIFCFDKKGVLRDVNDNDSVITEINDARYAELRQEGVLADGIIPKLENAFAAIHAGVAEVLIGEASDLLPNTKESTEGTLITRE